MPRTSLPLSLLLPLVVALSPASALAADAGSYSDDAGSPEGGVLAQTGDRADRSSAQKKGGSGSKSDSTKKDSKSDSKKGAPKSEDKRGSPSSASPASRPASRPASGSPSSASPSSASPSSASPSHRSPAPYARGEERTASPARDLPAARPTPGPVTRAVSVGSASTRPAAGSVHAASASPANFRSTTARSGADRSGTTERHGAASHGGASSDAARARHADSRHDAADRHAEASRHAHATAAHHRTAAAYRHRSAASRHRAWASHARGGSGHWYAPGSWFRPYRAGHAHWYHGVFVYGPGPRYGHGNGNGGGGGQSDGAGSAERVPERKVDRARTFAVGVRGGSYLGGYSADGGGFGDAGLGVAARYRLTEAVGLEVSWMHHNQTWDEGSERVYQPIQGSVQLFGMPWTKVNPYLLAGVTVAGRQVHDNLGFTQVDEAGTLVGPHGGLGIEFGIGKKASINFDARYTGYLNKPAGDLTIPGALQANMGLNFYF